MSFLSEFSRKCAAEALFLQRIAPDLQSLLDIMPQNELVIIRTVLLLAAVIVKI
jgi:hypothetical protein